jgi:hypothetical protein
MIGNREVHLLVAAAHHGASCSGRGRLRRVALSNAVGGIGSDVPASSGEGAAVQLQFGGLGSKASAMGSP